VIETEKEQGMFLPSPSHTPPSLHPTIVGRQRLTIMIPIIFRVVFFIWSLSLTVTLSLLVFLFIEWLRSTERTRERLNAFVTQMKTALAALTGGLGL
jgi:hypothetical protein